MPHSRHFALARRRLTRYAQAGWGIFLGLALRANVMKLPTPANAGPAPSRPEHLRPAPANLRQLTSLRFFAALAVLSSHLWLLQETPNLLRPLATHVFHEGYAGVSFFFILSGYILSHTYQQKLRDGAVSRSKYLLLRLARIYPLHLATALPFAIYLLAKAPLANLPVIGANLLLLQSWAPIRDIYFSLNAPSWSLSDEQFFYVAFVGLAFLSTRRLSQLTLFALTLACTLVAALLLAGRGAWTFENQGVNTHWWTYINPAIRLLDFMLGMLIYRLPKVSQSTRHATLLEAGLVAALIAATLIATSTAMPEVLRAQLFYLPLMGGMIYAFGCGAGGLSRALTNKRLVFLGEASFALYLVHLPILNFCNAQIDAVETPPSPALLALGMTLLAVLASIVTHVLIERPVQLFLKRRIDR